MRAATMADRICPDNPERSRNCHDRAPFAARLRRKPQRSRHDAPDPPQCRPDRDHGRQPAGVVRCRGAGRGWRRPRRRHRLGGSGAGRGDDRRGGMRDYARPRQHASPPLPDPDARGAGGPGRAALRLAEDPLSDLGAHDARGHSCLRRARARRTRAQRLHDERGPPLSLSEWRPAGRHDRGGAGDRHPLSPHTRRDEPGRKRGWPAPRQPGGGRARHP